MDHHQHAEGFAHLSEAAIAEITIGGVILIFLLFIFALFYCLRAKGCWGAIPGFGGNRRRDSHVFSTEETSADVLRRGLDASAIKALSSLVYRPEDFKEGLECSVCLSELFAGEAARLLPLCNHVFHVQCIDIWFQSHSTCPLCRSPVLASDKLKNAIDCRAEVTEVHHETIHVSSVVSAMVSNAETGCSALDEGSSSSSGNSSGMLVVEMPRRVLDELSISSTVSPLPLSDNSVEEMRSPSTTRLQSLRRFVRGVASPGLPSGFDVEQGVGSVPKIPACF